MAAPQFQPTYIDRFVVGLKTQRSPLITPITVAGMNVIQRKDALIAGSNVELTNNQTIQRRPGWPTFCSATFGVSEWPLNFFSWRKNDGTVTTFVDTQSKVYKFTGSTLTALFTKSATQQTNFQNVGNTLYFVNGTDLKKTTDGSTTTKMGIAAPVTAPTISIVSGSLSPTVGYFYGYAFKSSTTGHVSTMSPLSANTGLQTSKNFTLAGDRSTDAQVDTVQIYRTDDGGSDFTSAGNSAMFLLAEIANPGAGTWSFTDSTPDAQLNTEITANLDHIADPPPAGMSNLTFYQGRMWGTVGNLLYFGAGADLINGVPEEAWPPANVFKMPGTITALMPTGAGLMVFCSDSINLILGGPDTLSYFPQTWMNNIGVLTQNAINTDSETLYIYTTNRQLMEIDQQSQSEVGFDVGNILLSSFDPSKVYLAAHRSGTDQGLFVSDGSTSVFRYSINNHAWSPLATITGGIGAIASLETTSGTYTLVGGRVTGSASILGRNLTSFVDGAASTYTCSFTIGSLTFALAGSALPQLFPIASIVIDRMPVGTEATVKVLLNDISGTFTSIPKNVSDPPQLAASTGVISRLWDVSSAALPRLVKHMQIQVSFAAEAFQNEVLAVTIQPQQ
jgi:hypothetical protein